MTTTRIPVDIIELIIDEVSAFGIFNRMPTLKACALICWDFVEPAQRRLFKKAHLPIYGYSPLYDIIAGNPDIALYVKDLLVTKGKGTDMEPTLPNLLKLFQNLTTFHLTCGYSHWDNLVSKELEDALKHIMLLPTLQCLDVSDVKGIPSEAALWITQSPAVSLSSVLFRGGDAVPYIDNINSRIEDLTIDETTLECGVSQSVINVLRTSKMKKLFILIYGIYSDDSVAVQNLADIIKGSHATLENLEWWEFTNCYCNPSVLNLGMFTQLDTLTLCVWFDEPISMTRLYQFLSSATRNNKVKTICLVCMFVTLGADHWKSFDELLASGEPFKVLQKVSMAVVPTIPGSVGPTFTVTGIRKFLPKLSKSGRLDLYEYGSRKKILYRE